MDQQSDWYVARYVILWLVRLGDSDYSGPPPNPGDPELAQARRQENSQPGLHCRGSVEHEFWADVVRPSRLAWFCVFESSGELYRNELTGDVSLARCCCLPEV